MRHALGQNPPPPARDLCNYKSISLAQMRCGGHQGTFTTRPILGGPCPYKPIKKGANVTTCEPQVSSQQHRCIRIPLTRTPSTVRGLPPTKYKYYRNRNRTTIYQKKLRGIKCTLQAPKLKITGACGTMLTLTRGALCAYLAPWTLDATK